MTVQVDYYREFALFCEALANPEQYSASVLLTEASTLLSSPIAKNVGAQPLIKYLLSRGRLAHDQPYTAVRPRDITWSELKDRASISWVFFTGIHGTIAVRSGGKSKEFTMVFSPAPGEGEISGSNYSKSNEMLKAIKDKLGTVTGMYYGADPSSRLVKRDERVKQRAFVKGVPMDPKELLKKFRPLIEKSVTAALANVKGHLMDSIKNDSFTNAKAYVERARLLRELLDHLDYHQDDFDLTEAKQLREAMSGAIAMTASHYYPELTGQIRKHNYYVDNQYGVANEEGKRKLLQDIAQGNKEKIGTILYYFKRILVAL